MSYQNDGKEPDGTRRPSKMTPKNLMGHVYYIVIPLESGD
jgi:hypothetical protein